jgi:hypothetical protein
MGYAMTITTAGKFLMDRGAVGHTVAFLAGWQLPVGRMTFCTGQGRMLCLPGLQHIVCLIMTTGAYYLILGNGIGDIERGVNRMTGQAVRGRKNCHGAVVFMALVTLRNTAMFL